jgi:hypothetical protein
MLVAQPPDEGGLPRIVSRLIAKADVLVPVREGDA